MTIIVKKVKKIVWCYKEIRVKDVKIEQFVRLYIIISKLFAVV